jgi:hypothetical protein
MLLYTLSTLTTSLSVTERVRLAIQENKIRIDKDYLIIIRI